MQDFFIIAIFSIPLGFIEEYLAIGIGSISVIIAIIILVLGIIVYNLSEKMKDKTELKNASIWAIITIGNIAGIFTLIGGIIGVVDSSRR